MLHDQFKSKMSKLTTTEKRILDDIDRNIANINSFSISEIAEITFSSTTSIHRLVSKLDLSYSDFKFILYSMKNSKAYTTNEKVHKPSIYVDQNVLLSVTNNIKNAKRIYIIGVGQSSYISRYFFDILFKMGFDCHIITDSDLIISLMQKVTEFDYLIYISSSGSTSTLVDAAKTIPPAKSLVITSKEECQLSKFTDDIICSNSDLISHKHYSFSLQGGLMQIIDIIIVKLLT